MPRKSPRDSRGRFLARGGRRRKNPSTVTVKANPRRRKRRRAAAAAPRFASSRRRRRNPPRTNLVNMLMDGALGAVEVVGGKVAVRALPGVVGLPSTGTTGLAVQAAVAVGLGWVVDMVAGPDVARTVLAGGLAAPLETVLAGLNIPVVSPAVGGTMGAYVRAQLPNYAPPRRQLPPPAQRRPGVVVFRGWQTSPPGSGIEYFNA